VYGEGQSALFAAEARLVEGPPSSHLLIHTLHFLAATNTLLRQTVARNATHFLSLHKKRTRPKSHELEGKGERAAEGRSGCHFNLVTRGFPRRRGEVVTSSVSSIGFFFLVLVDRSEEIERKLRGVASVSPSHSNKKLPAA